MDTKAISCCMKVDYVIFFLCIYVENDYIEPTIES